jgi:hypothetical protein
LVKERYCVFQASCGFTKKYSIMSQSIANARIEALSGHLSTSSATSSGAGKASKGKLSEIKSLANLCFYLARAPKSPDDVVIISALRSALTKGGKGAFKETHPEYIMANVLKVTGFGGI